MRWTAVKQPSKHEDNSWHESLALESRSTLSASNAC